MDAKFDEGIGMMGETIVTFGAVAFLAGLGLLFSALVFRKAVGLSNLIVAGRGLAAAPEPSTGKAVGIVLATLLAAAVTSAVVDSVVGTASEIVETHGPSGILLAHAVPLLTSFVFMAVLVRLFLPTSVARGLLISLLNMLIGMAIVVGMVLFAGAFIVVFGLMAP